MKFLFLLTALMLCTYTIQAQQTNFGFSFNHQALSVKDVEKSAVFYKKILKLDQIINRTQMPGIIWFSLGEGKELHLVSTLKEEVKINKAIHLAISTPHFADFIKHLEALAIPYSDWPGKPNTITTRADGILQIYLQDPDGYWIEVNSFTSVK